MSSKVEQLSHELHGLYGQDPVGFIHRFFSFDGLCYEGLTQQQIEIATAFAKHKNVAIAAGGGIGKTALTAMLIQWFLLTHPFSKIPTTAPTGKQLNDVLWSEISFWLRRNVFRKFFVLKSNALHIVGHKEWFAVPRTVNKDKRELNDTLAGFHAPYVAIFVDEASGVPDPVFTALTGTMTNKNAFIMLISNPVSYAGFYYDTISDPQGKGRGFKILKFSALDSPLVDKSFEDRIISRYGKDSPMYQAKVLGLPITMAGSSVVSPELYDHIVNHNKQFSTGDVVLGVDVGGDGKDPSIICHKSGNSIIRWDEITASDDAVLTNEIVRLRTQVYPDKPVTIVIDSVGLGWGPSNTLANLAGRYKFDLVAFKGSKKSAKEDMYVNKRTEGYHYLSKNFHQLQFPVEPPSSLKKQLAGLLFDFKSEPISMETKQKYIARTGSSPNEADALMMACSVDGISFELSKPVIFPGKVGKKINSILSTLQTSAHNKYGKYGRFVA